MGPGQNDIHGMARSELRHARMHAFKLHACQWTNTHSLSQHMKTSMCILVASGACPAATKRFETPGHGIARQVGKPPAKDEGIVVEGVK